MRMFRRGAGPFVFALAGFAAGEMVTPEALVAKGIIKKEGERIKILAEGELDRLLAGRGEIEVAEDGTTRPAPLSTTTPFAAPTKTLPPPVWIRAIPAALSTLRAAVAMDTSSKVMMAPP